FDVGSLPGLRQRLEPSSRILSARLFIRIHRIFCTSASGPRPSAPSKTVCRPGGTTKTMGWKPVLDREVRGRGCSRHLWSAAGTLHGPQLHNPEGDYGG